MRTPLLAVLAVLLPSAAPAAELQARPTRDITLANGAVTVTIRVRDGIVAGERLAAGPAWSGRPGADALLETSGGFSLELVWNDWQAPGKPDNADNLVRLTAADFVLAGVAERQADGGAREVVLTLSARTGLGAPGLGVEMTYRLDPSAPYLRRSLRVVDAGASGHFLDAVRSEDAEVRSPLTTLKVGGFGQPVAATAGGGGWFAGLEWPAADNLLAVESGATRLRCGEEIGEVITPAGVAGSPAVLALTPDERVKLHFAAYLDAIRVAPLRPYTLYNSWYDLRSAEYPKVAPERVMNEANVRRVIGLLRTNMVEKHGIALDAFVLDDGWDVYDSDWTLRSAQFPNGLAPLVADLSSTGTRLGMWLGPSGGYSFHARRVAWMRAHGYEVTANGMLCVGGARYSELLRRRTVEMARQGVGYFKWDGFQLLCSDPTHGHPIGIHARRALLDDVAEMARGVRAVDPAMFLNITSGTWLSPWWLGIANQIWMQGEDYGAADVPSISTRDSSITYRDLVLYEDFRRNLAWFPVANLMTHGILRGTIDVADIGRGEPLSKFADEVAFYLARGVTMAELYISPDVLGEGEWNVLAGALRWWRDRFEVLKRGEMIGGDPGRSEPYGWAHLDGERGIVAVRNPDVRPAAITVTLDPALGLDPHAARLVLERVYPTRWVAPRLVRSGDAVALPLSGFEAAVYEIRPLREVAEPLLADVVFEERVATGAVRTLDLLTAGPEARVLNPERLAPGQPPLDAARLAALRRPEEPAASAARVTGTGAVLAVSLRVAASARQATLGVLLRPEASSRGAADPVVAITLDGSAARAEVVRAAGVWAWHTLALTPGKHAVELRVAPGQGGTAWSGTAQVWLTGARAVPARTVTLTAAAPLASRPLPPTGRGRDQLPFVERLGDARLATAPSR
jgi:hypothetical protein